MKMPWAGFSRNERARFPALKRRGHNGTTLDRIEHEILEKETGFRSIPLEALPAHGLTA